MKPRIIDINTVYKMKAKPHTGGTAEQQANFDWAFAQRVLAELGELPQLWVMHCADRPLVFPMSWPDDRQARCEELCRIRLLVLGLNVRLFSHHASAHMYDVTGAADETVEQINARITPEDIAAMQGIEVLQSVLYYWVDGVLHSETRRAKILRNTKQKVTGIGAFGSGLDASTTLDGSSEQSGLFHQVLSAPIEDEERQLGRAFVEDMLGGKHHARH